MNISRLFNDKGADELVLLDIGATRERRPPDYSTLREVASQCFMPLAYGGGIDSLETAGRVFECGVEKVVARTATVRDPNGVREAVRIYGAQAVTAALDLNKDWGGRLRVHAPGTRVHGSRAWIDALMRLEDLGIGEILLTAVHRDGTREGLDLEVVSQAAQRLSVPLVIVGGVGSLKHVRQGLHHGAQAVGAGSFFVFQGNRQAVLVTYPDRLTLDSLLD